MNPYISNFSKIIMEICEEEKIECIPFSDYWAFYLKYKDKDDYIYGYQFGLNSAVSHSICSDKSMASEIMTFHKIPNVEHRCCMSPVTMEYASPLGNWNVIEKMLEKHSALVCKDNHGTGGDQVYLVHNQLEAEHASQLIFSKAESMAVSPYYDIETEYRVILLQDEVTLVYSKVRPHLTGDGSSTLSELYASYILESSQIIGKPCRSFFTNRKKILKKGEIFPLQWKHNLGQGATAKIENDWNLLSPILSLAKKAKDALKISFASVDIIRTSDEYLVLEVNSGVMMEYLAGENKEKQEIAKQIYKKAILQKLKYSESIV